VLIAKQIDIRGDAMKDKKYTYRVRPGCAFGAFKQYGPGATVELTEDEASGFLDKVVLVKDAAGNEDIPINEAAHLATLTVGQLKGLPEFADLPNPKPTTKPKILDAILEARGLLGEEASE